jgi:hypothetical protein
VTSLVSKVVRCMDGRTMVVYQLCPTLYIAVLYCILVPSAYSFLYDMEYRLTVHCAVRAVHLAAADPSNRLLVHWMDQLRVEECTLVVPLHRPADLLHVSEQV